MSKKKTIKPERQLAKEISFCEAEYRHWYDIYENGCHDPTWEDGVNLWLVKNHIAYHKKEIKNLCVEHGFPLPEILNRDDPPEVPMTYMARPDEIRRNSRKALNVLKSHTDYAYLQGSKGKYDKELNRRIDVVLGYVSNLEHFISEDNLVGMRQHERPDIYLDSFRDCVRAIGEYVDVPQEIKPMQLSLI